MPNEDIRDFWEEQARSHGTSHQSSWSDLYCMHLELDNLLPLVSPGDNVLDVGCANGYGTLWLAERLNGTFGGLDYAQEMIAAAEELLEQRKANLQGAVSFAVGDVLGLEEADASFEKVITRRVLINLGSLENQIRAAGEIHRVLKPEGLFLMSEAVLSGLNRLNALRREFGLEELSQPWHNLYIDEERFLDGISHLFTLVEAMNFSSTYYIGSRVLQPFVKNLTDEKLDYLSEINRLFSLLPSVGDYGIQKLFVFRKK